MENIFQDEFDLRQALLKAKKLLEDKKIIRSVRRFPFYHDEPKFFGYAAVVKEGGLSDDGRVDYAGGSSLIPAKALMAALGEAIERHCLSVCPQKGLLKATYKSIKKNAINIFEVVNFSEEQLKSERFRDLVVTENDVFAWVGGYSIMKHREVLVPAQLVYVPYKFLKGEKMIREPISTGAAAGTSLGGAIYRGLCEVVERDAFMITYLNKLTREGVDLKNSGQYLKDLADIYRRYNLELHVVNITTDIEISTFLGLLLDYTGIGPAVSVGLAADIDPLSAAIRAAEEAQHSRAWIRDEMLKNNNKIDICKLEGRGLYWSTPDMIEEIKFIFSGRRKAVKDIKGFGEGYSVAKLKKAIEALRKLEYDVIFVEVTTEGVQKAGFRVVKVIVPQLQPLYLDECYPYLGGDRLISVPKKLGIENVDEKTKGARNFNTVPHPFL